MCTSYITRSSCSPLVCSMNSDNIHDYEVGLVRQIIQLYFAAAPVSQNIAPLCGRLVKFGGAEDAIENVLRETVFSDESTKFPPGVDFQKRFLKCLINVSESAHIHVETLFCAYADKLLSVENDVSQIRRSYKLSDESWVSVVERAAFISNGTTGLHSWPAGLCMANLVIEQSLFGSGKRILELGSGVGASGLIIMKCCHPRRFVFSDCAENVLELLRENVSSNDASGISEVRKIDLFRPETIPYDDFDIVFGCDLVFDPALTQALVLAIAKFMKCKVDVYISCAVRNEETLCQFEECLGSASISFDLFGPPKTTRFWYDCSNPVRIYHMKLL